MDYKLQKEQFVTGFSGSNPLDVLLVCSFLPVRDNQAALLLTGGWKHKSFLGDFGLVVLPIVLSVTATDYSWLLMAGIFAVLAFRREALVMPADNIRPAFESEGGVDKFYYISAYRSLMLLATAVSILAVDFPAYPRRFVKTETFGVSLVSST
jgi:phosphatidylinositol glycan class W